MNARWTTVSARALESAWSLDRSVRVLSKKMQQQDDRCIAHGKRYNPNCSACPNGPTEIDSIPLTLEIEPGMKNGDQIKFEDVADEQVGHTPGDLIIELAAEKHAFFTRKGDDLHMRINIPLVDALAGFSHTIQHVDGHDVLIAPRNIIHCNSVYRVNGEGMPQENGNRKGDVVVRFNIDFPTHLSDSQKSKLRKVCRKKMEIEKVTSWCDSILTSLLICRIRKSQNCVRYCKTKKNSRKISGLRPFNFK